MRLTTITALICLACSEAYPQVRTEANVAAEFAIGTCYRALDDISRVRSYALLQRWTPLSADMANLMKPVDATAYQGWHAVHEGQHFFVGVNVGNLRGRPVQVCSVMVNQAPADFLPRLLAALKVGRVHIDTDAFQTTETYELQHPTQSSAALSIVKAVDGRPPVTLGFMGFR